MARAAAIALATSLSCASTPSPEAQAPAATTTPAAAKEPLTIVELALGGLRLGSSLEEAQQRAPDLAFAPPSPGGDGVTTGVLRRDLQGIASQLTLRFYADRLYEIVLRAAPASVSSGAFTRLSLGYEAALGPPERTRCSPGARADGPPSLLRSSWRSGDSRWTNVELRSGPTGVTLEASDHQFTLGPPPPSDELGMMVNGRIDPGPRPSCAERRAAAAQERANVAPPSLRPDPGCRVDLRGAPPASFLGLRFGASRAELEAATGPLRPGWHASFDREVLGQPAGFTLYFYEGCLAIVIVELSPPTLARYEALSPVLGELVGQGAEQRCTVAPGEGPPRLSASTRWSGRPDLEAELRLEPAYDCPEEDRLGIELSYPPLRAYAPHIDF